MQTTVQGLVGIPGPYTYERKFFAQFFPIALVVLGAIGVIGLLVLIFRPLQSRQKHTEQSWDHAERLVRTYGWDTLAYFALRDDKSFYFSSDGEAIAFSGKGDGKASLWRWSTGAPAMSLSAPGPTALGFSRDGTSIATGYSVRRGTGGWFVRLNAETGAPRSERKTRSD